MSPIKEPHYFCKDIRCDDFNDDYKKENCLNVEKYLKTKKLSKRHIAFVERKEEYMALYRDFKNEKICGEVSNGYLYSDVAAKEIYKYNPSAKIIVILRDPVERAFSHWLMDLKSKNVCRRSFVEAVEEDYCDKNKGWGKSHLYVELGLYCKQVKRYLDVFSQDQILILDYYNLKENPKRFMEEIYSFLNVEPISIDFYQRYNSASMIKYPMLNSMICMLKYNLLINYIPDKVKYYIKSAVSTKEGIPVLTYDDRVALNKYFIEDVEELKKIVGCDLSKWRI